MSLYPPTTRQRRLNAANELIKVIASCGRRFFYNKNTGEQAELTLDWCGRIWLKDECSGQRIQTHSPESRAWRHFSHGGTLKLFIICLRDYITDGKQFLPSAISIEHWGYGENILHVLAVAAALGLLEGKNQNERY